MTYLTLLKLDFVSEYFDSEKYWLFSETAVKLPLVLRLAVLATDSAEPFAEVMSIFKSSVLVNEMIGELVAFENRMKISRTHALTVGLAWATSGIFTPIRTPFLFAMFVLRFKVFLDLTPAVVFRSAVSSPTLLMVMLSAVLLKSPEPQRNSPSTLPMRVSSESLDSLYVTLSDARHLATKVAGASSLISLQVSVKGIAIDWLASC